MAYKSLHHTFHPSSRPKSPNISLFLYFASNPNIFYPPQISYLSVDLQSLLQLFLPSGMLSTQGIVCSLNPFRCLLKYHLSNEPFCNYLFESFPKRELLFLFSVIFLHSTCSNFLMVFLSLPF